MQIQARPEQYAMFNIDAKIPQGANPESLRSDANGRAKAVDLLEGLTK
jgi:hypothetical protein